MVSSIYHEDISNAYLFASIQEIQEIKGELLKGHNAIRPHETLVRIPPYQFANNNST